MSWGPKPNFSPYPNAFIFPKKCLLEVKHLFWHGVYFLLHTLIVLQRKKGREIIKEQKEKKGGSLREGNRTKIKLIAKMNRKGTSVMNRKSKSCLLQGEMAPSVFAIWVSLAWCCDSRQGDWEELLQPQLCGSKPARVSVYIQLHMYTLPVITACFPNMEKRTFLGREMEICWWTKDPYHRKQAIDFEFWFFFFFFK